MNDHNLKPAKPGEVRNPNGKPKGKRNRATIAKELLTIMAKEGLPETTLAVLRKLYGNTVDDWTMERVITLVQIGDAISGKRRTAAYKAVMDSAYGLPKQEIDLNDNQNVVIFQIPDNGR